MQTILTQAFSAFLTRSLSTTAMAATLALSLSLTAKPLAAQGLFSPAVTVDSAAITNYELQQRALFMGVLRTPGNPEIMAREELIKDRLKLAALEKVGILPGAPTCRSMNFSRCSNKTASSLKQSAISPVLVLAGASM